MNFLSIKSNCESVVQLVFVVLLLSMAPAVFADEKGSLGAVDGDGWHRWTVDAVDQAPNWCCYMWRNKDVTSTACNLDADENSYGSSSDHAAPVVSEMQIFAKLDKGVVKRINAFGDSCTVNTRGKVANHGKVDAAVSLRFLGNQLTGNKRLVSHSLAAIAVHDSTQAQSMLEASSKPSQQLAMRKDAIFWMGQVRARQSANTLEDLMLKDKDRNVREHAIFSVSQSVLRNRLDLIERAARNDESTKVRGQAWFWMAQTEDSSVEQRIRSGMDDESSEKVQLQAVFALSQLEGESGSEALIRVIETANLGRKVRKQALFWLAQSESDRATEYLATVLNR